MSCCGSRNRCLTLSCRVDLDLLLVLQVHILTDDSVFTPVGRVSVSSRVTIFCWLTPFILERSLSTKPISRGFGEPN